MAKRGPKSADDLNELHKIFEKRANEIIREDGKVRVASDKIWATLKRQYQIKKSGRALHTAGWKWNENLKYQKEKSLDISAESDLFEEELNSSLNELSLDDADYENEEKCDNEPKIAFLIKLTSDNWDSISPVPKNYKRAADESHKKGKRLTLVLKPGTWTSLLAERIAEHPKSIICDWAFKVGKVAATGRHYVSVLGYCVTCGSILIGFLQNEPKKNEDVVFKFVVKDFDHTKHQGEQKKVKVTGSQALSLATSTKAAVVLHRNMSAKSGAMFEASRGRVPSAHAIRNLQYYERKKQKLSSDIFKSLFYLQNSPKYANVIHVIGYSSFYVMYGSPKQFSLYNMYLKRNKNAKLSCDATGGLVRKIGKYDSINN